MTRTNPGLDPLMMSKKKGTVRMMDEDPAYVNDYCRDELGLPSSEIDPTGDQVALQIKLEHKGEETTGEIHEVTSGQELMEQEMGTKLTDPSIVWDDPEYAAWRSKIPELSRRQVAVVQTVITEGGNPQSGWIVVGDTLDGDPETHGPWAVYVGPEFHMPSFSEASGRTMVLRRIEPAEGVPDTETIELPPRAVNSVSITVLRFGD